MKFYIYLNVPQYVKEWALNTFSEDGHSVHVKRSSALHGLIKMNLIKRQSYHPKEETGNLPIEIWNISKNNQVQYYNYMTKKSRDVIGQLLFQMMFAEYWVYALPLWRMIKGTHTRTKRDLTMQNFTLKWFEQKGITCDEPAIMRFSQEFYRERKRIWKNHKVSIE